MSGDVNSPNDHVMNSLNTDDDTFVYTRYEQLHTTLGRYAVMPTFRITINGNEYTVAVPNPYERPVRAIVNGETVEVHVENDTKPVPLVSTMRNPIIERVINEPAAAQNIGTNPTPKTPSLTGDIKSPLPGIIVSISVVEGDRVESGQELCVLEAMKMNNPIRSTVSGSVTKIYISIGQQVQHGVPLMTIEE